MDSHICNHTTWIWSNQNVQYQLKWLLQASQQEPKQLEIHIATILDYSITDLLQVPLLAEWLVMEALAVSGNVMVGEDVWTGDV